MKSARVLASSMNEKLSGFGKDHEPAAQYQKLQMTGFDASAAIENRIHTVIAIAEITTNKEFATPKTHEKGSGCAFEKAGSKGLIQLCHRKSPYKFGNRMALL